jgi:histidinol-phosphate phosphatase family protein
MTASRAAFLDLQGTLGGAGTGDIRTFSFYLCAVPAIRLLNEAGILTIVITNQSHISRGEFTLADFDRKMDGLRACLAARGCHLDAVFCCPHTADDGCSCRKPMPGMIYQAQRKHDLDLPRCFVVGDVGAWDMRLARHVGCQGILVRTGLGEGSLGAYRHLWAEIDPDYIARDVYDAARWIVQA